MKSKYLVVLCLPMLIVLSACQSTAPQKASGGDGPSDAQRAADLWQKIQGYENWKTFPGWEGWQESDSIHGDYVKIYVNDTNPAFPAGSIIVKEGFKKSDPNTLRAITVMERLDGFNPDSGDWLNVRFTREGKASKINSKSCYGCHEDAEGKDFVFLND